jgi:hypothetical protein
MIASVIPIEKRMCLGILTLNNVLYPFLSFIILIHPLTTKILFCSHDPNSFGLRYRGEMDQASGKKFRGEGRVQFLSHQETFRQEIEKGWPLTAVYDRHKDKLDISYMQFSRYVQRFITGKVTAPPKATKRLSAAQGPQPESVLVKPRPQPKTSLSDPTPLPDSELF